MLISFPNFLVLLRNFSWIYFNTQRFLLMSNLVLAGHSAPIVLWTPHTPPTSLKFVGHVNANVEQMNAKIVTSNIKNFI